MKKLIILSTVCITLAGASANAAVSFGISVGQPVAPVYPAPAYPAYVEPGPGYVVAPDWPSEHYDRHIHRHNEYWAHREHAEHKHG